MRGLRPATAHSAHEVTEAKIRHFAAFPAGWFYGGGRAFDSEIVKSSIELNRTAVNHGFLETDVFPGTDGELLVTVYHGDRDLEFALERDGTVTFCSESGGAEIDYEEGLSLQSAIEKLASFKTERLEREV